MVESAWFIALAVLVLLIVGGSIAWLLMGRRPAKFDPRHERLVQALTRLYQDNPRKAVDVIARALVRGGLVWEADIQGSQPQSGGASSYSRQPRQAPSSRPERRPGQSQPHNVPAPEGGQGPQGKPGAGAPRGTSDGSAPDAKSPSETTAQDAQARHSRRRRRRRPPVNREQPAQPGSAE